MRNIFLSFLFTTLISGCLYAQRYSFGTDYAILVYYPEDFQNYVGPLVVQCGLAAAKEISLRSSVASGLNYYQTNIKKKNSARLKSSYMEIPLYLKINHSMYDRVFKSHIIFGTGFNMLVSEKTSIKDVSRNEWTYKETHWKPEAVNFSWGLGFDVKINRSFYLSFDGLCKVYYLFRTTMNDSGDKLALIPMTKGGIFVFLNK